MAQKTGEEWIDFFDEHRIPCGPILSIDKVLNHPQVKAQDMVVEMPHPKIGKVKLIGVPIKLSETPGYIQSHPPLLGEHNEEVLTKILKYSQEEIEKLKEEGVI